MRNALIRTEEEGWWTGTEDVEGCSDDSIHFNPDIDQAVFEAMLYAEYNMHQVRKHHYRLDHADEEVPYELIDMAAEFEMRRSRQNS
ncbi:MAG: hypothetical protein AAF975_03650 [Spirochaetota bacterium]